MSVEARNDARDRFVTIEGRRYHYLEWADVPSPCLVMLHGFASSARGTWDLAAPEFAATYRVVAIDLRGHGESDWGPDTGYEVANYVADVERLVADLALSPFFLVGHSMGGAVALTYAARRPQDVRRLVLVDSGARDPNTAPLPDPFGARPLRFASRADAAAFVRARLSDEAKARAIDYGFVEHEDRTVTWRSDIAGLSRSRQRPDPLRQGGFWAEIEALRCPTLVLRAGRSGRIRPHNATRMERTNPLLRVVEYPEAGHWLHKDEPERFFADVSEFFATD